MKQLWSEIGFTPTSFELEAINNDEINDTETRTSDAPILKESRFPSNLPREAPTAKDIEQFDGMTIKNIPSHLDDKEITTFLFNYGLPQDHGMDLIRINKDRKNTWVVVEGLTPDDVNTMFNSIHFPKTRQKFFDAPIYCRPLRNMTPVKVAKDDDKPSDEKSLGATAKNPPGTPNPDTDHSTSATGPHTIPGLTKNQQKKAAKKAQKKTNKVEKEDVEKENPTVNSKTKTRKDFMKTDTFDDMDEDVDDIENSFVFEERTEKSGHSKFFTKSPASAEDSIDSLLSPGSFDSTSAKQIQKEELWKQIVQQNANKRNLSPEAVETRSIRKRCESLSSIPTLVKK